MNGLSTIVDASYIFHKDYVTFYNRDWNSISGTNFGITCGKYFIKIIFDIKIEIGIFKISNVPNFNKF